MYSYYNDNGACSRSFSWSILLHLCPSLLLSSMLLSTVCLWFLYPIHFLPPTFLQLFRFDNIKALLKFYPLSLSTKNLQWSFCFPKRSFQPRNACRASLLMTKPWCLRNSHGQQLQPSPCSSEATVPLRLPRTVSYCLKPSRVIIQVTSGPISQGSVVVIKIPCGKWWVIN